MSGDIINPERSRYGKLGMKRVVTSMSYIPELSIRSGYPGCTLPPII